jgi:hypothetical protein
LDDARANHEVNLKIKTKAQIELEKALEKRGIKPGERLKLKNKKVKK